MCSGLYLAHRLHQRVAYHNRNIRAGVTKRESERERDTKEKETVLQSELEQCRACCLPLGLAGQLLEILLGQHMCGITQMDFKHDQASMCLRQRNVDTLLESSTNGRIENPWYIRGAQHKNAIGIIAHTLHLHQELRLDATHTVVLIVRPSRTHRIDFIDKYNRWLMLSGQFEEILYQFLGFTQPFGHQIRTGYRKECGIVCLGGNGLGQIRFTRTGWTEQQDTLPWHTLAGEELWKLDGQDDSLFECLLGSIQTSHIGPLHLRFLNDNGIFQFTLQLLFLWIISVLIITVALFVLVILGATLTALLDGFLLALLQILLEFLCAI